MTVGRGLRRPGQPFPAQSEESTVGPLSSVSDTVIPSFDQLSISEAGESFSPQGKLPFERCLISAFELFPTFQTDFGDQHTNKASGDMSSSEHRASQIRDLESSTSNHRSLPERPGFGQNGQPISLLSNFFPIKLGNGNMIIHHYDVNIERIRFTNELGGGDDVVPETLDINSKRYKKLRQRLNFELIQKAVTENSGPGQMFEGLVPVFDGSRNLYTVRPIETVEKNSLILHRVKVSIDASGREERFAFNIKPASKINMARLTNYFIPGSGVNELSRDCLQALDIILRYGPSYLAGN